MAVTEIVSPNSLPQTGEQVSKLGAGFQAEMPQDKTSIAIHEKAIGGGTQGGYSHREDVVAHDGQAMLQGVLAENGQMLYYGPAYGFPYQPTFLVTSANAGSGANKHGHPYVHYYQQPLYSDRHYYPVEQNVLRIGTDQTNTKDSGASQKAKFGGDSNLEYQENLLKTCNQYNTGVEDGNYYGSHASFDHYLQHWYSSAQEFLPAPTPQSFPSVPKSGPRQFQSFSRGPFVSRHSDRFVKGTGRRWQAKESKKSQHKVEVTADNNAAESSIDETHRPPMEKSETFLTSGPDCCEVLDQFNITQNNGNCSMCRTDYNKDEFQVSYESAKFFVIKSYSEDDVHKSIKYGVWSSTPSGNKRLNEAYQKAQEKSLSTSSPVPIFLFFSVNCSGQFCGVAEMMGTVDFNRNMDFWLQGKWNGCIPLKWHIIKDIPNGQFRHIILSNNDNRPVTHSRDTQEVYFHQGLEMLKIFKLFPMKTSLLDDFVYYDIRQKILQERKIAKHVETGVSGKNANRNAKHVETGVSGKNANRNRFLQNNDYDNGSGTNKSECNVNIETIQCQVAALKVDGDSKTSKCRAAKCVHTISDDEVGSKVCLTEESSQLTKTVDPEPETILGKDDTFGAVISYKTALLDGIQT